MKISRLFLSVLCLTISINFSILFIMGETTGFKQMINRLISIYSPYLMIIRASRTAWDKVESDVFNSGLAELINNTPIDRLKEVLGLMDDMVLDPDEAFFQYA